VTFWFSCRFYILFIILKAKLSKLESFWPVSIEVWLKYCIEVLFRFLYVSYIM
jgi:hypothetical protein